MYVTSAARLRSDIAYYINKLRMVQNRRLHNNSWLMTLPFDVNWTSWHASHIQRHGTSSNKEYIFMMITSFSTSSYAIHADAFQTSIYIANKFENIFNTTILRFYRDYTTTSLDTADYWPMAREYSIWNAAIASLQFRTEDLNPVTLGRATEHVYTTLFYSSTSHTLCKQSNETLFWYFVITLNAALTSNYH